MKLNITDLLAQAGGDIMNTEELDKSIHFEKASQQHEKLIFTWLAEPHMMEFWDNTQEHKDDIMNFIHGRKQHYFYGTTQYWIGFINEEPFCFILSDELLSSQTDLSEAHQNNLSKLGRTVGLDFGIGNTKFLGKGLAAPTLAKFTSFYHEQIDPSADTFFIDPDEDNPRAIHVYEKAGFKLVGEFDVSVGAFIGHTSYLMIKVIG